MTALPPLGTAELEPPVRRALGEPDAHVGTWDAVPVAYDFLNPSSGGVFRVSGTATAGGRTREWRLVLKMTRSAEGVEGLPALPPADARRHRDAIRWDRELLAYESGFLGQLDGTLVAARCFGGLRAGERASWLWLEDLSPLQRGRWDEEDWALVARSLGELNGGTLVAGPPAFDWLGREWLRAWVTLVTPSLLGASVPPGGAWDDPRVRSAYPEREQRRLRALWSNRERLLAAIEALPRTVAHLDAHRRNLFLRRAGGGDRVVAIDWGLLGLAAPGEEIASTLVGTVAAGELAASGARAFAGLLYEGYLAGLREAGWHGDERAVRLGFAGAAALRAFSVTGLHGAREPDAEGAEDRLHDAATLVALLLDLGDEALALARL